MFHTETGFLILQLISHFFHKGVHNVEEIENMETFSKKPSAHCFHKRYQPLICYLLAQWIFIIYM